jgi:hypothetical protein
VATKKQKREVLDLKRTRREAEIKETGLKALRKDRENRENKLRDQQREKHDKGHSWKKIDRDCILCQDLLRAQREEGHI